MKRTHLTWMLTSCIAGTAAPLAIGAQVQKELPMVSVGAGLTLFNGDVGSANNTGAAFRNAWRFGVEQRFHNWIGAELFAHYGTLAKSERSVTLNRNFESPLLFVGANAVLYFDNDVLIPRGSLFSPYITAGFGWMSFDPYGDLKDKNNNPYYYWSDGSIHNLSESDPNASTSVMLNRDYTYETQLKDSTTNYSRSSFAIPVGVGFRWSFGRQFGANLQANYFVTFTDYIDNAKEGGNDSYLWCGVSLYYKFGKRDKEAESGISAQELMNEDFDNDGVPDGTDVCQGTPVNVKVDSKGCPVDEDGDGIADYLDKEPGTKKGAIVDGNGVAIDYEKISREAERDSINAAQKTTFASSPSIETLKQGDQDLAPKSGPDCIPTEYRAADVNKDCIITADEINTVIDQFFDGEGNWTADGINRLIDYFFDQ